MDVIVNLSVLGMFVVTTFARTSLLDPLVSLGISLYIVYAAFEVGREAVDHPMDRALPEEMQERVRAIALGHPEIVGMHKLRTRSAGSRRFIEMHLEIDGTKSLREAHDAAREVARAVEAEITNARVLVHTDPADRAGGR